MVNSQSASDVRKEAVPVTDAAAHVQMKESQCTRI